jgi:hypothetical protein
LNLISPKVHQLVALLTNEVRQFRQILVPH